MTHLATVDNTSKPVESIVNGVNEPLKDFYNSIFTACWFPIRICSVFITQYSWILRCLNWRKLEGVTALPGQSLLGWRGRCPSICRRIRETRIKLSDRWNCFNECFNVSCFRNFGLLEMFVSHALANLAVPEGLLIEPSERAKLAAQAVRGQGLWGLWDLRRVR